MKRIEKLYPLIRTDNHKMAEKLGLSLIIQGVITIDLDYTFKGEVKYTKWIGGIRTTNSEVIEMTVTCDRSGNNMELIFNNKSSFISKLRITVEEKCAMEDDELALVECGSIEHVYWTIRCFDKYLDARDFMEACNNNINNPKILDRLAGEGISKIANEFILTTIPKVKDEDIEFAKSLLD